jgi:outer membrane lipoprotein-sorting protein
MAWAAVFPDKIRITFLLSGLPVETIVADGKRVTFFSHTGEHARHTFQGKDPDMENYIRVPVRLSEIIRVLLGRLPVKPFDDAYFSVSDLSLSTVFLRQEWTGITQALHFDGQAKVHKLVSMNRAGNPTVDMTVTRYKTMDSDPIPIQIEIRNQDRAKLTLDILNFQSNPSIKESVFRLTDPGS